MYVLEAPMIPRTRRLLLAASALGGASLAVACSSSSGGSTFPATPAEQDASITDAGPDVNFGGFFDGCNGFCVDVSQFHPDAGAEAGTDAEDAASDATEDAGATDSAASDGASGSQEAGD
jgi:hypothetical protein